MSDIDTLNEKIGLGDKEGWAQNDREMRRLFQDFKSIMPGTEGTMRKILNDPDAKRELEGRLVDLLNKVHDYKSPY